jgi:hypothetical protein
VLQTLALELADKRTMALRAKRMIDAEVVGCELFARIDAEL